MLKNGDKATVLNVRISKDERGAFSRKAAAYGSPSHVLRELIRAYIDGRLVVTPRTIEIQ